MTPKWPHYTGTLTEAQRVAWLNRLAAELERVVAVMAAAGLHTAPSSVAEVLAEHLGVAVPDQADGSPTGKGPAR